MFGSVRLRKVLVSLMLIGFCVYIVQLFARGAIILYIHPRYSIFSAVMCAIGIVILLVGLVLQTRRSDNKLRLKRGHPKVVDCLVLVVLVLAFALPARALSSQAITRKAVNIPSYETNAGLAVDEVDENAPCPDMSSASLEVWVYQITRFPRDCYQDKTIELTGFVFESPDKPLPADMFYLGRVVMSCCAVDARPYALPIKTGAFQKYPKNSWVRVKGVLKATPVDGQQQFVVEPDSIVPVENPGNPYEYLNKRPSAAFQELLTSQ